MLLQSSVYNLWIWKKFEMHQYLFFDYHLVYILAIVWDTSMSVLNSAVFLHTILDPLNKADLILATQSNLLPESSYLKSTAEGLSFQISVVLNASKTFCTLFPYLLLTFSIDLAQLLFTCWKSTIKTPQRRQWRRSGVFIVILNRFHTLLRCFYCRLWASKSWLGVIFLLSLSRYLPQRNY